MNRFGTIEEMLRRYKLNKERIIFLQNQKKRLTPENHEDYIEYRMYGQGYSGATPRFVLEDGLEVAELNKVEATAQDYRYRCEKEYRDGISEMNKELNQLIYYTGIVEDGLNILERVNERLRAILEKYYIHGVRMEDIADGLHISRSRCYELCKEGLRLMARVIYGESMMVNNPADRKRHLADNLRTTAG